MIPIPFAQCMSARSGIPPLLAGAGALGLIGVADCTAMQVLRGEFGVGRTITWALATLVPLMVAAAFLAARPWRLDHSLAVAKVVSALSGLLVALVAIDLLLFPAGEAAEWLDRARSKLPGAAAFVALGFAAGLTRQRRADASGPEESPVELAAADAAAIADARLVRAAGNYVEAHLCCGRVRLIRVQIGQVAQMPQACGLVRLHRSLLVRASAIADWRNDRSGLAGAVLDDGTLISIGRKYRKSAYHLRNACRSSPHS